MKGDRPGSRSGEIRSLLRRPGFRYLYIAQTASVVGDAIIPIALAFAVLQLTGSPAALGLVLAARILPTVVLLLIGGVIADRLPRRAVMMASDLTRFGSQALAGVLLLTGDANLASMIVLQLVAGTAAAFFQPASSGLLPEVVPAKDLQPANGLIQLSENFAWTLGPALGGLLVALVSPGAALIFDGVTFLISAIALWMLKVDRRAPSVQENPSILRELRGGWTEFRTRTWLWTTVAWAGTFHLLVLPAWQIFGPSIARDQLGGAPAWALITTCSGLGSVLGGVIALRMRPRYLLRASFVPLGMYGLQLLALGLLAPVPVIAAAALVSNIGLSMFNVFSFTAMQQNVPIEAMGRVSSYEWLGSIALLPIGQALIAPIGSQTSPTTMLIVAAGWMAITPVLLFMIRSARNLRAVDDESLAEAAAQQAEEAVEPDVRAQKV
ncbi:MFS transporter [Micromonospora ureilytica]|nr:MFS transporter [Micromonospora ureilytica]